MKVYKNHPICSSPSGPTVLIPGDGTTVWSDTGSITTTLGSVAPLVPSSLFDKGGSFGTVPISTDFTLVADINTAGGGHIVGASSYLGVSDVDPDGNFTSLLFSFQTYWGSTIGDTRVYTSESGTRIGTSRSTFVVGDTLKITRVGTEIKYYINTTLLYTSLVTSATTILFDSSMAKGFIYENISITY